MKLETAVLKKVPKVLLHEHLDGVLRPKTVIELADTVHYTELPTSDPESLAQWFHQGANQGSLAKYLEGFQHTIAVMQTEEALERVAYEQAEDLSQDGVVYFETRFAPIFHTRKGLTHQQVVSAVLKGLARGRQDFGVQSGLIICAMRNMNVSLEIAELAVDFREPVRDGPGADNGGPRHREISVQGFYLLRAGQGHRHRLVVNPHTSHAGHCRACQTLLSCVCPGCGPWPAGVGAAALASGPAQVPWLHGLRVE